LKPDEILKISKKNESLTQTAGKGALWWISSGLWQTGIRLGASAVLARNLNPSDFGLFGMAMIVNELIDRMGPISMGSGLIAKKDITQKDLSTCFWMMSIVRFVLFLAAFFSASFASAFFANPDLENVLRVISVIFLFSIISIVPRMILNKKMEYRRLAFINSIGVSFESCLAVVLVLTTGLGYWSLVFSMVIANLLINITLMISAKWYPAFLFDKESFKYLYRYGINSIGATLLSYLSDNLDYFLVGKFLGAATLGLYEFAYRVPHLIVTKLIAPASGVIFPSFSVLQDDNNALVDGLIRSSKYIAIISFPILGGLAVVSEMFVPIVWGEKWLPIVTPLRILCFAAAVKCLNFPINSIFLCKNRPDIPFKLSIIIFFVSLFSVSGLSYLFGLNGTASGMVISSLVIFVGYYFAIQLTYNFLWQLFKNISISIISTVVSMSIAYGALYFMSMNEVAIFVNLIITVFIGVIGYIGALYLFFNGTFYELIQLGRTLLLKKNPDANLS